MKKLLKKLTLIRKTLENISGIIEWIVVIGLTVAMGISLLKHPPRTIILDDPVTIKHTVYKDE